MPSTGALSSVLHISIRSCMMRSTQIHGQGHRGKTSEKQFHTAGSSKDEATKAISDQLILAKAPETRPNLKKGQIPWTDNWTIEDVPQEVKFVRYEQGSGK